MSLPSLRVVRIAAADPELFESLLTRIGFRIIPKDNDPLATSVQTEAVMAVASAITEDTFHGVKLDVYRKKVKLLAEQAGYVVMVENVPELPEEEPEMGGMEGEIGGAEGEMGGMEDEMGGVEDEMGGLPPEDLQDGPNEVEQIAQLPIGTELANEILAVINGTGMDDGMEGEMGGMEDAPHGEHPMGGIEAEGEGRPF